MGEIREIEFRYSEPIPPHLRTHCYCGCKKYATHRGMVKETEKIRACEITVKRWIHTGKV